MDEFNKYRISNKKQKRYDDSEIEKEGSQLIRRSPIEIAADIYIANQKHPVLSNDAEMRLSDDMVEIIKRKGKG